ncbi:MAG: hypothetical protein WC508_04180 [Patescibacteria group bacterium]
MKQNKTENLKPGEIAGYLDWKQSQLNAIKTKGNELAQKLLATVPEALKVLFGNDPIIENLLEFGLSERKYRKSDGPDYGFTNLTIFERRLRALGVTWKGIVQIDIERSDGRLDVIFSSVIPTK